MLKSISGTFVIVPSNSIPAFFAPASICSANFELNSFIDGNFVTASAPELAGPEFP